MLSGCQFQVSIVQLAEQYVQKNNKYCQTQQILDNVGWEGDYPTRASFFFRYWHQHYWHKLARFFFSTAIADSAIDVFSPQEASPN